MKLQIEVIKQIKSELRFLNCQGIKYLVHEADLGSFHADSKTIENRKSKLRRLLNEKMHYMLFKRGEKRYLCNQAVGTTKNKMTKDWNKINCENCLKQRSKWEIK